MTNKLAQVKAKLLSTSYPRWRNILSSGVLFLLSTGMVFSWWWIAYTTPDTGCHKGVVYLSGLWLFVQWLVIGYLFWYDNIPTFARDAIKLLILMSNVWFGFFIFSLKACT
ncbi:hypothetical protein ACFOEK_09450 [Litoribrevibacter euphylliae]|uniref:Uncharacterized protein n=1 Tax=Litoribrevibacter euphylliae TaxID=1834034 RepID=A0ABV7HBF5_9GAMM